MQFHIGVDPGVTGAVAVLETATRKVDLYDTPIVCVKSGKKMKNVMDLHNVVSLMQMLTGGRDVLVTIEKVNAMPGKVAGGGRRTIGATSAFNFGVGYGMWLGVLASLRLPYQQVIPATWKRALMLTGSDGKDADRIRAIQLYPQAAPQLNLKKHHGRADALLLADWARRTYPPRPSPTLGLQEEPF